MGAVSGEPKEILLLLGMRSQSVSVPFRWPAAVAVINLHLIALASLSIPNLNFERDIHVSQEAPVAAEFFVDGKAARDAVPIPELILKPVSLQTTAVSMIQFESEDWGDISAVVAASSAPQLSRFQPADPSTYARTAGLPAGQAASVVLILEVLPDGTVGTVEIARGFGDPSVDAAAIAYGRTLRWIPGTREHRAQTVRISFPVTLIWKA